MNCHNGVVHVPHLDLRLKVPPKKRVGHRQVVPKIALIWLVVSSPVAKMHV